MGSNPRKFSEKIALHTQKQAEETAAFERIMKEVIGATKYPNTTSQDGFIQTQNNSNSNRQICNNNSGAVSTSMCNSPPNSGTQLLDPNQLIIDCRAESLPNVNHLSTGEKSKSSIDLRSALSDLNQISQGRNLTIEKSIRTRLNSPNQSVTRISSSYTPNLCSTMSRSANKELNVPGFLQMSRSQGNLNYGPMTGDCLKSVNVGNNVVPLSTHQTNHSSHHHTSHHHHHARIDCSPYYLSPPPVDPHWRRAASDSALHQSTVLCEQQQQQNNFQQSNLQSYYNNQQQSQQVNLQHFQQQNQIHQSPNQQQHTQQPLHSSHHQTFHQQSTQQNLPIAHYQSSQLNDGQTPVINMQNSNIEQNSEVPVTSQNYHMISCLNTAPLNSSDCFNGTANNNLVQRPKSCDIPGIMVNSDSSQMPISTNSSNHQINNLNKDLTHATNLNYSQQIQNVQNFPNYASNNNMYHGIINNISGSLPDLTLLNHQSSPIVTPIDQDDLFNALNSNDNSNNSNQSGLSNTSYTNSDGFFKFNSQSPQIANSNGAPSSNSPITSPLSCNGTSNQNSSNSNSPLHNYPNGYSNENSLVQNQSALNCQFNSSPSTVKNLTGTNINSTGLQYTVNTGVMHQYINKDSMDVNLSNILDTNQLSNQLTNRLSNQHISSPQRPSSLESVEDVSSQSIQSPIQKCNVFGQNGQFRYNPLQLNQSKQSMFCQQNYLQNKLYTEINETDQTYFNNSSQVRIKTVQSEFTKSEKKTNPTVSDHCKSRIVNMIINKKLTSNQMDAQQKAIYAKDSNQITAFNDNFDKNYCENKATKEFTEYLDYNSDQCHKYIENNIACESGQINGHADLLYSTNDVHNNLKDLQSNYSLVPNSNVQTQNSIPDIILTEPTMDQDFCKDINSSFDNSELLIFDEIYPETAN